VTAHAATSVTQPPSARQDLDVLRLARILVRFKLRAARNAFRATGRGRRLLVAAGIGVFIAMMYVGLFTQSFSIVATTVDLPGQLAVLALVTGTIAFGSLTARAASSEAVRAGSPENEFFVARPVPLHMLVAARGIADAVTDPVGGLFLLPVLIAATFVWRLGPLAWPIAAAISLLVQIGISTLSYAVQTAVVRYVPGRRRRIAWTFLRMAAALSLASLWMLGTYVMREPAALARGVGAAARVIAFSPSMLVSAPLGALVRNQPGQALLAMLGLAAAVAAAMLLTIAIARRAGMAGWEEAGAVWADAARAPAASRRLPTAATKDLRLIVRNQSELLALIALPAIFVGVQIFGAAGWAWTTETLGRVSSFSYSLAVYMGTIGPLTHMQSERRAFWILRTVPVPLGRLLAAKARAWAIILGGVAALVFTILSFGVGSASVAERIVAGVLVTAGAAGMSFVAVAMASGGADLSDETSTAVGPTTIYAYMFVGGLFNVMLHEDVPTRAAGLLLYAFAAWTYWQAGVEQAEFCLDAEAVRARRLRASHGATMLIIYAVGGRALFQAATKIASVGGTSTAWVGYAVLVATLVLTGAIGIAAAVYVARRPATPRRSLAVSLLIAGGAAAVDTAVLRAVTGGAGAQPLYVVAALMVSMLVEELVLRGIVQRALSAASRFRAAAITVLVGVVSAQLVASSWSTGVVGVAVLMTSHICGALVYALTGRVAAAWLARAIAIGVAAFV
jgi:hypothetical protein